MLNETRQSCEQNGSNKRITSDKQTMAPRQLAAKIRGSGYHILADKPVAQAMLAVRLNPQATGLPPRRQAKGRLL